MARFGLLVCLVSLLPAALAMREAVLSRRSTLIAAVLAAAPMPRYSALHAETLDTEGLQARRARCRTLAVAEMLGETREACEARIANTPQQSMLSDGARSSALIDQLKARTAANKEYNSRYIRVITAGANSGVYDAERNLRLVRLDGVPKLLAPDDIKKLEVAAPRLQPHALRLQPSVPTPPPCAPRRGATRCSAPTTRRCRASSRKGRPPRWWTPRCAARRRLWRLAQSASERLERTPSVAWSSIVRSSYTCSPHLREGWVSVSYSGVQTTVAPRLGGASAAECGRA